MEGMSDIRNEIEQRLGVFARQGAKSAMARISGSSFVTDSGQVFQIASWMDLSKASPAVQETVERAAMVTDNKGKGWELRIRKNGSFLLRVPTTGGKTIEGKMTASRPGAKATFASDVDIVMEQARKMHSNWKPIAERDQNKPNAGTRGGVEGYASSAIHFLGNHIRDLKKYSKRADKKEAEAAKAGLKEVADMMKYWEAMYRKVTASRLGVKSAFAFVDHVVKEDAQYIYYYPEEDDRATFADTDGKGAYTVKSNRTGKPVSAKTYRSWNEANSASNAMNEKLPPLKKRKGFSRAGEKASFGSKRTTAGALRKQLKAQGMTDAAELEWHGISASDPDSTPYYLHEDGSMEKIKSSRPGAKVTHAASFQIGDKVAVMSGQHMDAYGRILTLKGNRAVVASAEGNIAADIADLSLVKRGTADDLKKAGFMSRPGAKAAMARAEDLYRKLNVSVNLANAKEMERLASLASEALRMPDFMPEGNDWSLHELAEEVGREVLARKSRASRPGAKATAAKPEIEETEQDKAGLKLMEKADKAVSDKIRTLIKEGKPQDQAVAIALDMKRRGEL